MSKDILVAAGIVTALPIAFGTLVVALLFFPQAVIGTIGLLIGAGAIRAVVILANRRDDPRQVKAPRGNS